MCLLNSFQSISMNGSSRKRDPSSESGGLLDKPAVWMTKLFGHQLPGALVPADPFWHELSSVTGIWGDGHMGPSD
jgi:hypothetical protein